jgi:hypothetical protein
LKHRLLSPAIAALLLINILPIFPAGATQSSDWSKPRPTTTRLFNDTLGSATVSSDGQTALTLGVNIGTYNPADNTRPDTLTLQVNLAATTREGIDYEWTQPPYGYSWVNVNQPVGISGDNASILVQLPFTVLYYGVNYTSLWVYSNEFISFTSGNYAGTSPRSLPNNNMRDAIVAPFWRVLKLSQGGSIKKVTSSIPGRATTAGAPIKSSHGTAFPTRTVTCKRSNCY